MLPFVFVTKSHDKVREAERILGFEVEHQDIDLPEIQAIEVEEVVIYKAVQAYEMVKRPVIIEDTGLYIDIWNGLPGALIKWFLNTVGNAGICQMLNSYPSRGARARTTVATYDGYGSPRIFTGEIRGRVADTPSGDQGFGWDEIFIPIGLEQTYAELSSPEKDRFSMRRMAFEKMRDFHAVDNKR
jgi:non-canonical purine NTP pyrophosphatase (RdgB/HAM1 family)